MSNNIESKKQHVTFNWGGKHTLNPKQIIVAYNIVELLKGLTCEESVNILEELLPQIAKISVVS